MRLSLTTRDEPIPNDRTTSIDDENALINALNDIQHADRPRADRVQILRSYLHNTLSSMIRNHAALALVDLIADDAAEDIFDVLRACQAVVEAKLQLKPVNRLAFLSWRVSATA